jgi:hypothetical protein
MKLKLLPVHTTCHKRKHNGIWPNKRFYNNAFLLGGTYKQLAGVGNARASGFTNNAYDFFVL